MYKRLLRLLWENPKSILASGEVWDLVDIYLQNPDKLKDLNAVLSSDDIDVVCAGVLIASELGEDCEPVFDKCVALVEGDFSGRMVSDAYKCIASCVRVKGLQPVKYILKGLERDVYSFSCALYVARWPVELIDEVGDYIELNNLGAEHLIGFRALRRAESEGFLKVMVELAKGRSLLLSYYALIVVQRYENEKCCGDESSKTQSVLDMYSRLSDIVDSEDLVHHINICVSSLLTVVKVDKRSQM